jgi:cytochrome c oxidase assembly protein Cox11
MTVADWKQIDTSPPSKKDKRNNLLLLLVMLILIGSVVYKVLKREDELDNTKYTWAVVTDSFRSRNDQFLKVKFYTNKKTIYSSEFTADKCQYVKKIGDTIIINYSTKNPQTVEVEECFWNDNVKKKYKFYKW